MIDSFIKVNDKIPSLNKVRISISTKNLMQTAKLTSHICSDATFKLNWHNYPIILTGKINFYF